MSMACDLGCTRASSRTQPTPDCHRDSPESECAGRHSSRLPDRLDGGKPMLSGTPSLLFALAVRHQEPWLSSLPLLAVSVSPGPLNVYSRVVRSMYNNTGHHPASLPVVRMPKKSQPFS